MEVIADKFNSIAELGREWNWRRNLVSRVEQADGKRVEILTHHRFAVGEGQVFKAVGQTFILPDGTQFQAV